MSQTEITERYLLLVEGRDEEEFFGELVEHMDIGSVQVIGVGGRTRFKSGLKGGVKNAPGFSDVQSIGIVRDADRDPDAAFDSVCDALEDAGFPKPERVREYVGDGPATGVMILPDGESQGMLEDLILRSVSNSDTLDCVDSFFECVSESEDSLPSNLAKARMQAFLSSREWYEERLYESVRSAIEQKIESGDIEIQDSSALGNAAMTSYLASQSKPSLDVGTAARNGYWDFDDEAFSDLRQFVHELVSQ